MRIHPWERLFCLFSISHNVCVFTDGDADSDRDGRNNNIIINEIKRTRMNSQFKLHHYKQIPYFYLVFCSMLMSKALNNLSYYFYSLHSGSCHNDGKSPGFNLQPKQQVWMVKDEQFKGLEPLMVTAPESPRVTNQRDNKTSSKDNDEE